MECKEEEIIQMMDTETIGIYPEWNVKIEEARTGIVGIISLEYIQNGM